MNRQLASGAPAPTYIKRLAPSVRADFARATTLATMLNDVEPLTRDERALIVGQALILIEQNYAHLPLKRAMHAVDPVQRLKLLLQETKNDTEATAETELTFHNELTDIFTSLRDLHTNYLLPRPYADMIAFLPFMVEDCFEKQRCMYLVSHIVAGFEHPTFVRGVEVIHWNGTPIERAVRNNAQRYAGSNREARHARGVQNLTTRALRVGLPPDEDWVIVGYTTLAGEYAELRFDWIVNPTPPGATGPRLSQPGRAAVLGIDIQQQITQRARAALFAPQARTAHRKASQKLARGQALGALESSMPGVLEARKVVTTSGAFGYVRIRSFNVAPESLIAEFVRLVSALPKRGLILDVRGNGGGIIHSGEYLLQLLTPRQIVPEPAQFINTALNLQICARNDATSSFADLSTWKESMQQALQTGSTFSAGFPISDPEKCNAIGQRYFGPVVLITDALCYSTTDIFAAGFQDHEIGSVIGTHRNTGAGGANVWEQEYFVELAMPGDDSLYKPLPRGAGMRVSMRRTLRVGRRSGTPVEDLGVIPDVHHQLTPADVLEDNTDLKDVAGAQLAKAPVRDLSVTALRATKAKARLRVTVRGIERIDVYVDKRPVNSVMVTGRVTDVDVQAHTASPDAVELRGFDGDELVARYRIPWEEIARAAPARRSAAKHAAKRTTKAKRTKAGGVAEAIVPTPNAGDDAGAAAELSFAAFGGAAIAAAAVAAAPAWRTARCLSQLFRQVNVFAPGRKKGFDGIIGDAAHAARTSDHNPWVRDGDMGVVTACDITNDPQGGCDAGALAEAIRGSNDPRVKYVIWNRHIANSATMNGLPPWTWRPYTGANPHDHHVHISVKPDKAAYDSEAPWTIS